MQSPQSRMLLLLLRPEVAFLRTSGAFATTPMKCLHPPSPVIVKQWMFLGIMVHRDAPYGPGEVQTESNATPVRLADNVRVRTQETFQWIARHSHAHRSSNSRGRTSSVIEGLLALRRLRNYSDT